MKQTDRSRAAQGGGYAVQTAGLSRRFGVRTAVDRVDLLVPAGTALGYPGPDGAGKTTLIWMLPGLTAATSGSVRLLGHPVQAGRSAALLRVGAMAAEPRFLMPISRIQMQRLGPSSRPARPAAFQRFSGACVIHCPPGSCWTCGVSVRYVVRDHPVYPARSQPGTRLMAFRPSAFPGVVNPE